MLAITGEKWELQYKRKAIFLASRDLKRGLALFAWLILLLLPFFIYFSISYRCVSRNSIGESSTTLHLIVRPQLGVSVEPDLLVADFGSQAEFTCKIYAQDDRPTTGKLHGCQRKWSFWPNARGIIRCTTKYRRSTCNNS